VILDGSGSILEIRGNITNEEFVEFIDMGMLNSIPSDTIITYDGTILLKKKQFIGSQEYSVVFFKKS
jgi:hypothetical protein